MVLAKLTKHRDFGLLILRAGLGISMMIHGYPKVMGGKDAWTGLGESVGLPAPIVFGILAALTEFLGGLMLAAGLYFRIACILLACLMAGALTHHLKAGDDFNNFSHAMELLIVFVALIFVGPGKYSVDKD